ncbi:MAG: PfkB family carbohydrate kinase [Candidatus Thorarchaeota archaeon]
MQKHILKSDIAILGHFAKDIIEIDGKSQNALGGTVYYGGIAGSHMGLKITIITKLKKEDFRYLNIFKKNGINCIAYPSQETSGIKNIYSSKNMETRTYEPLGFAGAFSKEEIPEIITKLFVIGPIIAGELDLDLLDYLSKMFKGRLALDIQGFIRGIKDNKMMYFNLTEKEKLEIISKVDYLKIDETEAKILTNLPDLLLAGRKLKELGPKEILITHKEGIIILADKDSYSLPWRNKNNIGRTGRGDTAFISYLGSRLHKKPIESLLFAAALTSLKMESIGPFSLPLWLVNEFIKKEYNLIKL